MHSHESPSRDDLSGYIYVLSNPSMPGILKIGHSKHGGTRRATDIYRGATGVPTPFELVFEAYTENRIAGESYAHNALKHCRVSDSREFFMCEDYEAIDAVVSVVLNSFDKASIESDYIPDMPWLHAMAASIGCPTPEIIDSLRFISPDEMVGYVNRYRKSKGRELL